MEYIQENSVGKTQAKILCCDCGTPIDPNPANLCVGCIRTKVDIAQGMDKQGELLMCRFCDRYLQPPDKWIYAQRESKELLALCLNKIKKMKTVRLIDAVFLWTEPHSKRIKVKLTIQKEVMGGAILQQIFAVEFIVHNQMCNDCRRIENKDFWRAVVQVRQKCDHKKTLFYLEQLVLKHKAHLNTTGIKAIHGGIDFYYAQRQDAWKMVDFLTTALPCRYSHAQELISHDTKNNTYDYKHNYCVEIVPVCKDNIVCLSKKCAQSLGSMGRICVCYRVSNLVHLIDPMTAQIAEVPSNVYWRDPFYSLCQPRQLVEFTVIESEIVDGNHVPGGHGHVSSKHSVADVLVMKSNELGRTNAQQFWTKTHIGHLLNPGDTVLGFDLTNANLNNACFEELQKSTKEIIPDVILVKKVFDKQARRARRNWKLKRLQENQMETESMENDYNEFLDDLEEDPAIRQKINIYKDKQKQQIMPVEAPDDDQYIPQISLQEMLDDLHISDEEMGDAVDAEETIG